MDTKATAAAAAMPAETRTIREEKKFLLRSSANRLLSSDHARSVSKLSAEASAISFHIFRYLLYSASFPDTASHSANFFSCSGELVSLKCPAISCMISEGRFVLIIMCLYLTDTSNP